MPRVWKTVRVFISSTFRDMHAERDYLVRFVFPELRERCAKRQLLLVDVDLRWGVTEAEAEQGKVLEICLDEIERCRPFFVGLLGERYGWVPPKYETPDEMRFDWINELEPGHSITALEIYHGVLRDPGMAMRAFFYFRDPAFISDLSEDQRIAFLPENPQATEKLNRLKQDIRQRGFPVFENYPCTYGGVDTQGKAILAGLEMFGQRVLEDLWSAISQEYPEEATRPDELAIERAYHEAFVEGRCRRFVGRRDLLAQIAAYADGELTAPLVVVGAPGCGKSAVLANFARSYAEAHEDVFVLSHFIGVSPGSADIRRTLLRLCRELARRFVITDEIPEEYEELREAFPQFLEQAATRGKVVLLLDALNQLDETHHAHTLNWLPQALPHELRLIVSTQEGDCLDALYRRRPVPLEATVGPLTLEDRKEIVRQTLWDYRKRLDERHESDQMALLLSKGESDNPLYLIVACEELRVFGEFERVTGRIASLAEDVPALFGQVLERLERDHGRELVRSALSLLTCAQYGLLEIESVFGKFICAFTDQQPNHGLLPTTGTHC
jgi:telomerase protein component 1